MKKSEVIYKQLVQDVPTHNKCGKVLSEVPRYTDEGSLFSWYCPFCKEYF